MPLQFSHPEIAQQHKSVYEIGTDVVVRKCSPGCLLGAISDTAQCVRTGQTVETCLSILDGEELWLPLAGRPRSNKHVLGAQQHHSSPRQRWQKVIDHPHPNLMRCLATCDCMVRVAIVNGIPLCNATTVPPWQLRRLHRTDVISDRGGQVEFTEWAGWMADLARGLAALHSLGLSHGDPFAFNAMITDAGAVWIDFSHLTDDPDQQYKDVWALLFFTIGQTLRFCDRCSPSLLEDLSQLLRPGKTDCLLSDMAKLFAQPRTDLVKSDEQDPVRMLERCIARSGILQATGDMAESARNLLLQGLEQYYSEFLHWLKTARELANTLEAEHRRHLLAENETLRLTVPRAEMESLATQHREAIARLEDLAAQKSELQQQLQLAKAASERIQEVERGRIAALQQELQQAKAAGERVQELEKERIAALQQQEAMVRSLAVIRQSAERMASLMEEYKLHKSFRLARVAQLLRTHVGQGPLRQRLRFLAKSGRRLLGDTTPLSTYNALDPLIEQARQIAAASVVTPPSPVASTEPSQTTAPAGSGRATTIPYFGIRAPHGRRRVAILTNQLLDWRDRRPRFGGGERYAVTVARLLHDLEIDVHFFQPAEEAFEGQYEGFPVTTFPLGESFSEFAYGNCNRFTEMTREFDHILHNMPEYTSGLVREDAMLICHGIWFDHNNYRAASFRTPMWYSHLERAFRNPARIVSVDTNSVNYVRAMWPELAEKMRFIPNCYDGRTFYPRPEMRDPQRLTVLFPRRSQINRGSRILADILRRIPHDVRFCWVGEGDAEDTQIIRDLCKRDPRLSFHTASFDEMATWYQQADIAVIPTIACEGTSYSCVEAIACGCAVVSTHVGGLSDVVHTGMNGLLVDPSPEAIADSINRLIEDPALRNRFQKEGPASMGSFELQHWRRHFASILHEQGWTNEDQMRKAGLLEQSRSIRWAFKDTQPDPLAALAKYRVAIITRNAIHGGVESLIAAERRGLGATVIVAGGIDQPETCPFPYVRADSYEELRKQLQNFDVVLYHWLLPWGVQAVHDSGVPGVEFVHRTDTADNDKSVPVALIAHSTFLAEYLFNTHGLRCHVVEHPIDTALYQPSPQMGTCVGAVTSLYAVKGIDILLRAWATVANRFPSLSLRFYGQGTERKNLEDLARSLGIRAEFLPPTTQPWKALTEFRCVAIPSRIEGLPVTALETLALDVPVLASDLPGITEFNRLAERRGHGNPIATFASENVSDLAEKLVAILESSQRPSTRPYIQEFYSIEQHCSQIARVLLEAIETRRTANGSVP